MTSSFSGDGTSRVIAQLRRMSELVEPRHVIATHPKNEQVVQDAAAMYAVEIHVSEYVPPDKVYLIDRKALETPPEFTLTVIRDAKDNG